MKILLFIGFKFLVLNMTGMIFCSVLSQGMSCSENIVELMNNLVFQSIVCFLMIMFWWSQMMCVRCCVLFADKLVMEGQVTSRGSNYWLSTPLLFSLNLILYVLNLIYTIYIIWMYKNAGEVTSRGGHYWLSTTLLIFSAKKGNQHKIFRILYTQYNIIWMYTFSKKVEW